MVLFVARKESEGNNWWGDAVEPNTGDVLLMARLVVKDRRVGLGDPE